MPNSLASSLTSRVAGLPAWLWALGAAGALYWYAHRTSHAGYQTTEPNPQAPAQTTATSGGVIATVHPGTVVSPPVPYPSGGSSFITPTMPVRG